MSYESSNHKILRADKTCFRRLSHNFILFNRLLSPVLLNKSDLVRAKAGNFYLKSLNKCFSNYYQARTGPVFTETVTYVHTMCDNDLAMQ